MKKILIIEDERALARTLEIKLKKNNFESKIADNGSDGLAMLEKEKFDLIILDLIMPRVNGFMVLEEMKKREINIPVIVVSNLSQETDMQRVKELGAVDYFIKSNTSLAKIIETINKYLS